jgi:hypothetical protein
MLSRQWLAVQQLELLLLALHVHHHWRLIWIGKVQRLVLLQWWCDEPESAAVAEAVEVVCRVSSRSWYCCSCDIYHGQGAAAAVVV